MTVLLTIAVCLFPEAAALDFVGPMELLSFLTPRVLALKLLPISPPFGFEPAYLSTSKGPLEFYGGLQVLPTKTYDEVTEQFDILLIPGGLGTWPDKCPQTLIDFIRKQAPGAKYILSVCSGSEVLARAGVLDGKRATTNKSAFKRIQEETRDLNITWVPKARWVVDGNVWTSSGVTAGTDMGYAFLDKMVGSQIANGIRGVVEVSIREADDDEFAEFYGLEH
ncbi:hypothetical protein NM688_g7977 [Phlebia brevispora]|uniref:Uncharacterized protein n=1 Tax=Phlebia brevispora TaxID=194682 RepID=A0ACC1RZ54_9APHY|nr:hypothetical protein NM688_g7977 [Phlebia brevispora]